MCVTDTCAVVRSCAVGTSSLQNLTASCTESLLFLSVGNVVFILRQSCSLVQVRFFFCRGSKHADTERLDFHSFPPATNATATGFSAPSLSSPSCRRDCIREHRGSAQALHQLTLLMSITVFTVIVGALFSSPSERSYYYYY